MKCKVELIYSISNWYQFLSFTLIRSILNKLAQGQNLSGGYNFANGLTKPIKIVVTANGLVVSKHIVSPDRKLAMPE